MDNFDQLAAKHGGSLDDLAAKYGGQEASPAPVEQPAHQPPTQPGNLLDELGNVSLPTVEQIPGQLAQNLGVAGRGAVMGVASPISMIVDPLVNLINAATKGDWPTLSESLTGIMDRAGVPNANTEAQKVLQAFTGGVAGAGAMVKGGEAVAQFGTTQAARMIQPNPMALPVKTSPQGVGPMVATESALAPSVTQRVGQSIAAQPVQQGVGAGAGATAAELARQSGAPPAVQLGAALVAGGGSAAAVPSGSKTVLRAVATGSATPEEVGSVIKAASGNGAASGPAKVKLAEMAAVDQEAKKAAESLGLDIPADVFSDNPQIRAAAGLTRSVAGSEAEAAWRTTVRDTVEKLDEKIAAFDVPFIEGTPSSAVVSSLVKGSLNKARKDAYDEAAKLSDEVSAAVPNSTPASTENLKAYLKKQIEDVGGKENLSSYEKKLWALVNSPKTTYGLLNRERSVVGDNLGKLKDAQFGDTDSKALKDIYAAMAGDRKDTVAVMGSEELMQKLEASNLLFGKAFAIQDRIVEAFNVQGTGNIAADLPAAIKAAGSMVKQDSEPLNRILDIIPEDLHKQAVGTAIALATRAKGGSEKGGFGLSEFATLYPGLRANKEAYAKIAKALGPEAQETLRSVYVVSKLMTQARANVLTTGKANQGLVNSMTAENLTDKVLLWTGRQVAGKVPVFGDGIKEAMTNGSKTKLDKAGKLFNSEAFQAAMTGKANVSSILDSPEFKVYADTVKIPLKERRQWLMSTIATASQEKPPTSTANLTHGQSGPQPFNQEAN